MAPLREEIRRRKRDLAESYASQFYIIEPRMLKHPEAFQHGKYIVVTPVGARVFDRKSDAESFKRKELHDLLEVCNLPTRKPVKKKS